MENVISIQSKLNEKMLTEASDEDIVRELLNRPTWFEAVNEIGQMGFAHLVKEKIIKEAAKLILSVGVEDAIRIYVKGEDVE